MSKEREARWAVAEETGDRFLEALFAAEEREKLGFKLTEVRYDQIEEIGVRLGLSDDERGQLRCAMAERSGNRAERQPGSSRPRVPRSQ